MRKHFSGDFQRGDFREKGRAYVKTQGQESLTHQGIKELYFLLLKVWFADQQHQYFRGTLRKCRSPGPTLAY